MLPPFANTLPSATANGLANPALAPTTARNFGEQVLSSVLQFLTPSTSNPRTTGPAPATTTNTVPEAESMASAPPVVEPDGSEPVHTTAYVAASKAVSFPSCAANTRPFAVTAWVDVGKCATAELTRPATLSEARDGSYTDPEWVGLPPHWTQLQPPATSINTTRIARDRFRNGPTPCLPCSLLKLGRCVENRQSVDRREMRRRAPVVQPGALPQLKPLTFPCPLMHTS